MHDELDDGFQSQNHAWEPNRTDILRLLKESEHHAVRPILYGSNHCFLVTLRDANEGDSLAVYKPARGEYPLYDFPGGSLYRREVASWLINRLLDWTLVPPTVVTDGIYGRGSLQIFIESQMEGEVEISTLQRLALLDCILNNADRKSEHILLGEDGRLWGIDHGLTFHELPKLRTFLWHFAGTTIPEDLLDELASLARRLRRESCREVRELRQLITTPEWAALGNRLRRLQASRTFPDPRHKPMPYRW
jgi:hypothetical protein